MTELIYKQRVSSKELALTVGNPFDFIRKRFEQEARSKIEEVTEIEWIPLFDDVDNLSGITGIEFIARGYNISDSSPYEKNPNESKLDALAEKVKAAGLDNANYNGRNLR